MVNSTHFCTSKVSSICTLSKHAKFLERKKKKKEDAKSGFKQQKQKQEGKHEYMPNYLVNRYVHQFLKYLNKLGFYIA